MKNLKINKQSPFMISYKRTFCILKFYWVEKTSITFFLVLRLSCFIFVHISLIYWVLHFREASQRSRDGFRLFYFKTLVLGWFQAKFQPYSTPKNTWDAVTSLDKQCIFVSLDLSLIHLQIICLYPLKWHHCF